MMNPYNVLGLKKEATLDEIKNAYRKLSKLHHPDMQNGNDKVFLQINFAYRILSNPASRKLYDEEGLIMDEMEDSIEKAIKDRMRAMADSWVDNMLKGARTPLQTFALSGIKSTLHKIEAQEKEVKNIIEKLESLIDCITCTEESNIIHKAIWQKIEIYRQGMTHNRKEKAILDGLKEKLDNYEYNDGELREDFLDQFRPSATFTIFGG